MFTKYVIEKWIGSSNNIDYHIHRDIFLNDMADAGKTDGIPDVLPGTVRRRFTDLQSATQYIDWVKKYVVMYPDGKATLLDIFIQDINK